MKTKEIKESLVGKTKGQIIDILATESGDLVSEAIEIAKREKFLLEAILALASNKDEDVRKWVSTLLTPLNKDSDTKALLKNLQNNKNDNVKDAAWNKWHACKFSNKIKIKVTDPC